MVSSDKQFLVNVLKRPEELEVEDEPRLRELSAAYPWFQTPRLLLARTIKSKHQPEFSEYLPYASVYAQDRSLFFRLVNSSEELQDFVPDFAIKSTVPEKDPVNETDDLAPGYAPEGHEEVVQEEPATIFDQNGLAETEASIEHPSGHDNSDVAETGIGNSKTFQEPEVASENESETIAEETVSSSGVELEVEEKNPSESVISKTGEQLNPADVTFEPQDVASPEGEFPEEIPNPEKLMETGAFAVDLSKVEKPEDETVLPPKEIKEIPFRRLASVYTDTRVDFFHWLDQLTQGRRIPDTGIVEEEIQGKLTQEAPDDLPKTSLPPPVKEQILLIDRFIEKQPSITRSRVEFYNPVNMAKESEKESDELVTETLAKIYLKQGLTQKALDTYEKLLLKFPHKKAYFAALIDEIKATNNP